MFEFLINEQQGFWWYGSVGVMLIGVHDKFTEYCCAERA